MAAKHKTTNFSDLSKKAAPKNQVVYLDIGRKKVASEAEIRLRGLEDYFKMRGSWSKCLKWALFIILFFNIGLAIIVGLGYLVYEDEWFLRILLTTNLADIIGLAFIIVKFLFSNQSFPQTDKSKETT